MPATVMQCKYTSIKPLFTFFRFFKICTHFYDSPHIFSTPSWSPFQTFSLKPSMSFYSNYLLHNYFIGGDRIILIRYFLVTYFHSLSYFMSRHLIGQLHGNSKQRHRKISKGDKSFDFHVRTRQNLYLWIFLINLNHKCRHSRI